MNDENDLIVTNIETEFKDDEWYYGWYTTWTESDGSFQGIKSLHGEDQETEHAALVNAWLRENRTRKNE